LIITIIRDIYILQNWIEIYMGKRGTFLHIDITKIQERVNTNGTYLGFSFNYFGERFSCQFWRCFLSIFFCERVERNWERKIEFWDGDIGWLEEVDLTKYLSFSV